MSGPLRNRPLSMGLKPITGLADAVNDADAVNKGQMDTALADKAAAVHTHVIDDVTGLQTALDGKEPTITAGTTADYWRGDKTWQPLPEAPAQTWTIVFNAADQSISNQASYIDATDLSFSMAANVTYAVRIRLTCLVSGAGGLGFGVNGPSGAARVTFSLASSAAMTSAYETNITSFGNQAYVQGAYIIGIVENGATAGTFSLRMKQTSSNATASTLYRNSTLEYAVLA